MVKDKKNTGGLRNEPSGARSDLHDGSNDDMGQKIRSELIINELKFIGPGESLQKNLVQPLSVKQEKCSVSTFNQYVNMAIRESGKNLIKGL